MEQTKQQLLDRYELATRLDISPGTVTQLVRERRIPCYAISKRIVRFDLDEVKDALRQPETGSDADDNAEADQ